MNILHHAVLVKSVNITSVAKLLLDNLLRHVREHVASIGSLSTMTVATLLDPRFKTLGFLSRNKVQEAVRRLKSECTALIASSEASLPHPSDAGESTNNSSELWCLLDETVDQKRQSFNATADAILEVEQYLVEVNLRRHQDPLEYWHKQKHVYPYLYHMSQRFLCSPASSVPCKSVFSKAGRSSANEETAYNHKQ
ncbi:zinc finger BED domain-containing protein 4-like [Girardinichthys multiradiatus]|uniref:zinc finger BED domain-containing protein 4-like n=1 Tax=Girardinichthys multiradiatus TaxID=208333 RepID=UPI001FAC6EEE|nr:zinc finger BED domain-containing protein 4-like [Girardinichthys multiradiatus]